MDTTNPASIKQQLAAEFNKLAHQAGVLAFQLEAIKNKMKQLNQLLMAEEAKEAATNE